MQFLWRILSVSYTHLDVYKRQAVSVGLPVIDHEDAAAVRPVAGLFHIIIDISGQKYVYLIAVVHVIGMGCLVDGDPPAADDIAVHRFKNMGSVHDASFFASGKIKQQFGKKMQRNCMIFII